MKIKLQGGINYRDLGGIKNKDGKSIKSGLFIRGGNLSTLTDRDIDFFVKNYDVATVIDLRTDTEAEEKSDREIPGSVHIFNPLFSGATAGITHETGASLEDMARKNKDRKALYNAIPDMAKFYREMVTNDYAISQLANELNIIIDNTLSGKATIYHCTKGKDRTGITTTMILSILNVSTEEIVKDYLLTNKAVLFDGIKYWLAITILKFNIPAANKIFNCFVARKKYIYSFVESINQNYGSMEAFVRDHLKITDQRLDSFRAVALE